MYPTKEIRLIEQSQAWRDRCLDAEALNRELRAIISTLIAERQAWQQARVATPELRP